MKNFWERTKAFELPTALTVFCILYAVFTSIFWAYADAHNNVRYVQKEAHDSQRKEDLDRISESLKRLEDGQQRLLNHLLSTKEKRNE